MKHLCWPQVLLCLQMSGKQHTVLIVVSDPKAQSYNLEVSKFERTLGEIYIVCRPVEAEVNAASLPQKLPSDCRNPIMGRS